MQIIRTDIAPAVAATGESVLRVVFCGEGGDCVTVDMAGVGAGDQQAAIIRAKAILVQTATFDAATNEYDAASNGNFDEVAVTSANDGSGGVYILEYRDAEAGRRETRTRMPSFQAAREEAVRSAIEMLDDLRHRPAGFSGWLVRVRDESGGVLCAIDVGEAEASRQARH